MSDVQPAIYAEQRTVAMLLAHMEEGQFNQDASDALRDLVAKLNDAAVNRGGKPVGKLVITLDFKLDDGIIETRSDYKVTAPKTSRRKTIMWATPNNNLTPDNPRQISMNFRDVNKGSTIRTISDDTTDDRAQARHV
jgi:hypothetical protein